MTYDEIIEHVTDCACVEVEGSAYAPQPPAPAGSLYRNLLNGHVCQINQEDHGFMASCHVCYELAIDPPDIYAEDFNVYQLHREKVEKEIPIQKSK